MGELNMAPLSDPGPSGGQVNDDHMPVNDGAEEST